MKTLLVILCLCVGILSASWQDVNDPFLRQVKKSFKNVQLIETFDRLPDAIPNRFSTLCTTDAQGQNKWQFIRKGVYFAYFYGTRIKLHEDGICVLDLSFEQGIKTTQTEKRLTKPYVSYFFSCKDEDDGGDPVLARLAFCPSVLGGSAFLTIYRADDLNDWMTFRLE